MTTTHPQRTHILRALAAAGLLVVEMLAMGVQPALGTGQGGLTVHLTGNGSGEAVTSDGHIDCALTNGVIVTNRCDFQGYPLFTTVTLTVTSLTGSALCDNDFVCHSEGETNVYVVEIKGVDSWTGFFGLQNRYITVLKSGAGAGSVTSTDGKISCPASCHQTAEVGYTYGDPVTLHAVPASGSAFNGWTGMCAGQGATCTFKMTSADPEASTTAAFKVKAVPTPAPNHTAAPAHTAAPGRTQPVATAAPAATPIPADPGASAAPTDNSDASPAASVASTTPADGPSATPGAAIPASTPASLDSGWIAFLVLLVLVIGVSVGGAIAFVAMRRRAPPPAT